MKDSTRSLLVFVAVVAFMLPLSLLQGFVLCTLWGWFVVPFGAPLISLAHAIGLLLIIGMARQSTSNSENKGGEAIVIPIITPIFALGLGAIAHGFM